MQYVSCAVLSAILNQVQINVCVLMVNIGQDITPNCTCVDEEGNATKISNFYFQTFS
jgi:hypothetical protein